MTNIQHIESTIAKSPWVLPHGWKWYKWGDLVISYEQGLIRSNTELVENGTFYFKMHNIDENGFCNYGKKEYTLATKHELMKYALNDGDFLINVRNSYELVGKTCVVSDIPNSAIYNHMIVKITHVDERLNYFLNALFSKTLWKKYIDGCKKGTTTVIALYKDDLLNIPIPIPPESIFSKICSFEKTLLKKRTVNLRICAELEFMAKMLYDYWFTQFDFPNAEGKPYRTSGSEMVWNDQLKREIPKGWKTKRLSDICSFRNGINYEKGCVGNLIYKIANVRNITASSLLMDVSDFDEISLPSEQADRYAIKRNDIIIARSGTPGATRLILKPADNVIFCGFIICCTPEASNHRMFLAHFLKQLEGTNATKTGGSILQNVSQDTLKSLYVAVPNDEVIDSFNEKILPMIEMMQHAIDENSELTKLRDWLLPMLMNGQATVE